jgi:cell wall-associated NlpC family hydrolase
MRRLWKPIIALGVVLALLTTACGRPLASNEARPETVQRIAHDAPKTGTNGQPFQTLEGGQGADLLPGNQSFIPMITNGDTYYVPLLELVETMGFNYEWDEETQIYQVGYTDPIYEIHMNSTQAAKEEVTVTLPSSTLMMNGAPYIPLNSFEQLFKEELNYTVQGGKLLLTPTAAAEVPTDPEADTPTDESLNFGDDPEDPAGDTEAWVPVDEDELSTPVLKNINVTRLLSTARNYLGVKYKFGARTYSSSYRRFDCSSYTKFIFAKYGVKLYRTARSQAKQGKAVSRKSLRKGDLLFFYVPGRFKTNKTVGHVGIYIGNNNMIHAAPEPKNGVQITNINKAFWKKTFLKARRVAY